MIMRDDSQMSANLIQLSRSIICVYLSFVTTRRQRPQKAVFPSMDRCPPNSTQIYANYELGDFY